MVSPVSHTHTYSQEKKKPFRVIGGHMYALYRKGKNRSLAWNMLAHIWVNGTYTKRKIFLHTNTHKTHTHINTTTNTHTHTHT